MSVEYRRCGNLAAPPSGGDSLADILERVLDKGIVIAGDIQINLLDIELLTIKLRLIVASIDKAKEMGIDWWETDPALNRASGALAEENRRLRERLDRLERAQLAPEAAPVSRTERGGDRRDD
ncbi:MAG TPA: gas vesicle protein [Solirubrobacteraceae bacterium]|nr:gas vesicle protein [Solirubrobacteraceae bacterium]